MGKFHNLLNKYIPPNNLYYLASWGAQMQIENLNPKGIFTHVFKCVLNKHLTSNNIFLV